MNYPRFSAKINILSSFILPDLFWTEKILLLLDYLQIYGIIWNCANPWPWPYLWIQWTRFLNYANIDLFSMTPDGALGGESSNIAISKWGTMKNYGSYALAFAICQGVLTIVVFALEPWFRTYGRRRDIYRPRVIAIVLFLLYILYVPVNLAVLRLFYCEKDTNLVGVDHTLTCHSSTHIAYLICCSLLSFPSFIGLPIVFFFYTKEAVVYKASVDHEKRLQAHEIAYMYGLNEKYLEYQLWIISSFERCGVYFRCNLLVFKAVLLLLYAFVRDNLVMQACLIWITCAGFCALYSITGHRPYRNSSTDLILMILFSVLICNVSFGTINSFGVQNAVTVASVESLWLMGINVVGTLGVLAILVLQGINPLAAFPPTATMRRVRRTAYSTLVPTWIKQMKHSRTVYEAFVVSPAEVADIHSLEQCIRTLRTMWIQARSVGSIFSVILGDELEHLLIVHAVRSKYSLRLLDYWNDAYENAVAGSTFARRERQYILLNPRKRRIIFKLLSLQALLERAKGRKEAYSLPSIEKSVENYLVSKKKETEADGTSEEEFDNEEFVRQIKLLQESTESVLQTYSKHEKHNYKVLSREIRVLEDMYNHWTDVINYFEENKQDLQQPKNNINGTFEDKNVEDWYSYRIAIFDTISKLTQLKNDIINAPASDSSSNDSPVNVESNMVPNSSGANLLMDEKGSNQRRSDSDIDEWVDVDDPNDENDVIRDDNDNDDDCDVVDGDIDFAKEADNIQYRDDIGIVNNAEILDERLHSEDEAIPLIESTQV